MHAHGIGNILVKRTLENAIIPTRAYETDAGLDLYSPITISGSDSLLVDIGVAVAVPRGWVGFITGRSSQGMNGISCHLGVIDSGYHGSLKVLLRIARGSPWANTIFVQRGDRIGQLILLPVALPELVVVDQLPDSHRGKNGFGSTGK